MEYIVKVSLIFLFVFIFTHWSYSKGAEISKIESNNEYLKILLGKDYLHTKQILCKEVFILPKIKIDEFMDFLETKFYFEFISNNPLRINRFTQTGCIIHESDFKSGGLSYSCIGNTENEVEFLSTELINEIKSFIKNSPDFIGYRKFAKTQKNINLKNKVRFKMNKDDWVITESSSEITRYHFIKFNEQ